MTESESISQRLSEVVFNYPELYDNQHKDYGNKMKKEETWEVIGREMSLPGFKVKKKWKNLRDSYIKYLRNLHNTEEYARRKYAKWQWSSQMEKYRSFLYNNYPYSPRNTRYSSITDQDLSSELDAADWTTTDSLHTVTKREPDPLQFLEEPEEETESHHNLLKQSVDAVQSSTDECPPKKVRRTEPISEFGEAAECSKPNTAGEREMDVVDHLMLAYAKTIKRFSLRRQAETKMQIAQLILRQELEEIEERQERGNTERCTQL